MKTICIAGKNDIAVDVMKYCKREYPNNRLICVLNRTETGINSWQMSAKWYAEHNGVEILEMQEVYEIEDLLFISCEFDRIVKPDKFKTKELYNIHFSMLPEYKGCFPSVLPILHGKNSTGVTLHRMRSGIDTGEIIDQKVVTIDEKDSSLDLYKKLIKNGTEVVVRNINGLLNGDIKAKKQSKDKSSYYPGNYIDYATLTLDVNQTAYQIQNQIRAFSFRPYQLLSWRNVQYIDSEITNEVSSEKPGFVLEDTDIYTKISTIDYDIVMYKDTFYEAIRLVEDGKDARHLCVSRKIIESQDRHGWSLLTVAVYNNNINMAKWLIGSGANLDVVNNNGTTLLMYAKNCFINTGDSTMFEMLLANGVNVDEVDYYGLSLKDYCEKEGLNKIGTYKI